MSTIEFYKEKYSNLFAFNWTDRNIYGKIIFGILLASISYVIITLALLCITPWLLLDDLEKITRK